MTESATILASDVINQALPNQMTPFSDDDILGDCPECRTQVPLSHCAVTPGVETTYACPECGSCLLVIGAPHPDGRPWPGRGYRIHDFVLRNAVDLTLRGLPLCFPRSPAALETTRSEDGVEEMV